MKKIFILLCLLTSSLLCNAAVYAMTQDEADVYNNLYYPQSVYNGGINTAPQQSAQGAYVNPATGSTHVSVTDLTLPGVNGFDLNITRMYNSTNSSLFEAYLKETDIPYQQAYYMITGSKRVYKNCTNGNWTSTPYTGICLTPDFFDYIDTKTAVWMVKNAGTYEYNYIENPATSKLFTTYDEALEAIEYLNSTSWEIDARFPYDNICDYEVDYYDFEIETVRKTQYHTDYTDSLLDDTATERYSKLGAGWEFTFPYVETRYGYDDAYEYLHFGEKGTWLIDFSDGGDNNLAGYPINDIILSTDRSVTHDGERSKYAITEKDGTKYYFGNDGRLLIKQDRYGNQIKFYCDTESHMNVWGVWKDYPYLTKIVDTLGREIVFTFENSGSNYYMYMTITDPNDSENPRVYSYYMDYLSSSEIGILGYDECDELEADEWVLKTVTDPEGYSYTYTYDFKTAKFTFLNRNSTFYCNCYDCTNSSLGNTYIDDDNFEEFTGIHNRYALLKSSKKSGYKSYYFSYSPFIKNCTPNGSMMFYKAYESYEDDIYDYSDNYIKSNHKVYNYDIYEVGEYDGYIGYKRDDRISSSYNYAVKVSDKNVAAGKTSYDIYKYTYLGANRDKTILLTSLTDYGTDHNVVTDYAYDNDLKIVTGKTVKNYSAEDPSVCMTNSMVYTYDAEGYADILTETPNGEIDRTVTYTYNSTYHYPITKTYKRNETTTIREEYVPTSNNKSVEYINVYENDVLKSRTQYAHDSYGNIVYEKKYINSADYIQKQYVYLNGAFITSETTKAVNDNDNITKDISVSATYDYWGNPLTMTDANGNITSYIYDDINRVVAITNPDGSGKSYDYNPRYIREKDELENSIRTTYTNDRKIKNIYYQSLGVDYNYLYYDSFGNLQTEVIYTDDTNEEGNQTEHSRTEYTYDTLQRPLSKEVYDDVGTLLYKELYSYEITSDYVKETVTLVGDENNPSVVKSTYYNKYGDKIKSEVGSDYETYTTDYAGNITSVKSARANSEGWNESHLTEYDFMGNVLKETDELGNITRSEYDQLGRCVKSYDANNYVSEFKYDNLGRVIEQRTPFEEKDGTVYYSVKRMWYDNNGNIVKERVYTNAAGESESFSEVKYTYNSRNKLIMTESNDGEKSSYVQNFYDAKGNLLRVYTGLHAPLTINGLDDVTAGSDTEYAVTKYTYDKLSRLLSTTDALNKTETNTYDLANSLVLSSVDRNGNIFAFEYDGLGNQTSKSLSDGTNAETITYGLTGQPLSRQNNTTAVSYVYNDKGQLISETDSVSGTVKTYTYNAAGSVASMTVTRNGIAEISQSYMYDKLNRLISVSENSTVIAAYTYDNKNNRTQTVAVGGETTNYSYNLANVLTSLECGDKLNETYSYYLNGNQKSKVSNGQTTNYVYDSMNRLISENNTQYTFDDFGNRLTMSDGETITEYSYDLNNRLTESNEVTGDVTATTKFFYDYNGNQITKAVMVNQPYTEGMSGDYTISDTSSNYIAFYEYNCYNQLVGVDANGIISSYAYSPDGLRHSKTVDGNTITYVYDNANVIEEITADEVNKYYRGIEIIKNDDGLNYIYNGQGDVSLLTDSAGATVANYNFDAYGNQSQENTIYNPFAYRGEYTDSESGLVYLRARMYAPETGRFINEDPAKDGLNWYVYCADNPINRLDPNGLDSYIIYDANADSGDGKHTMADEAAIRKKQLKETWGTNVQAFGVSSAWEFKEVWNKRVGYNLDGYTVPIEEVVIVAHGSITGDKDDNTAQSFFYFENGGGGIFAKNGDYTVNNLDWKQMEWLTFSTCNSGNPDVYNLAYAFKLRMTINQYIVAWDGGTVFDYDSGQLMRGGYNSGNWIKDSLGQHSWYKYVDKKWNGKPKRERYGYRQIKG